MAGSTDAGLIASSFKGWVDVYKESKEANEMQEILQSASGRVNSFGARNKASAMSATERSAWVQDQQVIVVIFNYWKREVKVERMRRFGREKNAKKKQQLIGVKGLFKNFATELESGLKDGTPRIDDVKMKKAAKRSSSGAPSPKSG